MRCIMKLKQLFAIFLALVMLVCFCACETVKPEIGSSESPSESSSADVTEFSSVIDTEEEKSGSTPLFWKATDSKGNVVWLLGSIHAGLDEYYPLPEAIMTAYENSDALAVEADIVAIETDEAAMMDAALAMSKYLLYVDGTTLKDHISADLYERTVNVTKEGGLYNAMYEYYEPSMWMSIISNITCEEAGLDANLGIDRQFLLSAHNSGKEIIEIESAEEQYGMLGGFSDELQVMLLEDSVAGREDKSDVDELKELATAWGEGDIDVLNSLVVPGEDVEWDDLSLEYWKAMFTDRNIGMADFCADALDSGKEVFVIVGLAHFLGDDGIVALLTDLGYTVELVK